MAILRQVDKTFTFDEQRIEFNELAVDVYNLDLGLGDLEFNDINNVNLPPQNQWVVGNIIKWNGTEWTTDIDVVSSSFTVINNPNSGSGLLEYNTSNGQFTYTPPALFSGDYDDLTNKPTIPTDTNDYVDSASLGANNILTLGRTGSLGNVTVDLSSLNVGSDGNDYVNTASLSNNTLTLGRTGSLSDLTVDLSSLVGSTDTNDYVDAAALNGTTLTLSRTGSLADLTVDLSSFLDDTDTNEFIDLSDTPNSFVADKWLKVNSAGTALEWTNTPSGASVQSDWTQAVTTDPSYIKNKPTLFSGSYNDLTNKPTIPAAQIRSDWSQTDNTSLDYILNKPTIPAAITELSDIPGVSASNPTDGHVLKWDLNANSWVASADLQGSGGSGISLTDLTVVKPNPTPSGNGDVTYNDSTGAFTYTPPALFDGNYNSLTNLPTLFSGSYNDLTNKPTIPAAQVQTDWDATTGLGVLLNKPTLFSGSYDDLTDKPTIPAAQIQADWSQTDSNHTAYIHNKPTLFSGSYTDLTNKPTLFSGDYDDLTNKPTIPSSLDSLSDVTITAPSNDDVLKYSNGAWINGTSGSSTPQTTPNDSVAVGTICMWSGSVSNIPAGWGLCDGSTYGSLTSPDLRNKFIVGVSDTYSVGDTGGSADAVLVAHDHGGEVSSDGDHNHGGNTGNQSSNHSHGFTTDANGSHSHTVNATGSAATTSNGVYAGHLGSFTQSGGTKYLGDSCGGPSQGTQGSHAHNFSVAVAGSSNTTGSHNHGGNTGTQSSDHSHTINGSSVHDHEINSDGVDGAGKNLPPYYALCYIIKTSEFAVNISVSQSFLSLNDTPNTFTADKWLKVNAGGSLLEWADPPPPPPATVDTSDTPPANPDDGDLWWDSDSGDLKVYYEDVDSSQWVEASPSLSETDYIKIADLKSVVAASTDFSDFQTRIAAL